MHEQSGAFAFLDLVVVVGKSFRLLLVHENTGVLRTFDLHKFIDDLEFQQMYGCMYNGYALENTGGLAPEGWDVAELADFQQQGREAIIADIPQMGIIETAQANAAKVLVPMLMELGYDESDITIAFRKHYGPNDIMKLLRYED
jgi:hypothetical protein